MILFENKLGQLISQGAAYDCDGWGQLTTDTLSWSVNGKHYALALADTVGVSACDSTEKQGGLCFEVYAYPLVSTKRWFQTIACSKRVLRTYKFVCPKAEVRSQWLQSLQYVLNQRPIQENSKPRHLHIILNPTSGKRQAQKIYQLIKPIFENSNIQITLTQTTSINHGFELARTLPLNELDGLVVIGGDGTLYEVINGLMERPDWQTAIQTPIGIMPAGTGNGLCKTLLEQAGEPYDPISAAFLIAKGKTYPIDLIAIEHCGKRYHSFLSLEWAIASDVDIGSNYLRFLGSLRHMLYALFCILRFRVYKGRFSFLPAHPPHLQLHSHGSSPWQTIEDDFIFFWAMNIKWAAHDMQIAPHAQLDNGTIDVILIRKGISRLQLLIAFLKTATGEYINMEKIEYYRVTSFLLEPLTSTGILAVDGEQIDYSPLQANVKKGLACIMG